MTLDLLGYKSDSLPKPTDGLQNITTDVDHSFLAQTCAIFVLEDKKMKAKTEVLYHYFNINTNVVSLKDFVDTCKSMLHVIDLKSPLQTIDYLFDLYGDELDQLICTDIKPFNKRLGNKFLNIFDFVHFEVGKEDEILVITFSQDEFKYCNFLYFTEKEYHIDQIERFFDSNETDDFSVWKTNFINTHNFESRKYLKDGVFGILWKDEKYFYPLLTMMVKVTVPAH